MKAWKINFLALTMALTGACGSDPAAEGTTGGEMNTAGSQGAGSSGSQTNATGSQGGASSGAGATAGSGSPTGGSTAGMTAGGSSSGGTTGASTGGTTGPAGMGACTNAADKAIIDSATVAKLACEGAACVGNHIGANDQTLATCIGSEAPTLKMLSEGCRKCFQAITTCVPNKCLKVPGFYNGSGECPLSSPNTDYKKCPLSTTPDAKCQACQTRECAPAFTACSGLSM